MSWLAGKLLRNLPLSSGFIRHAVSRGPFSLMNSQAAVLSYRFHSLRSCRSCSRYTARAAGKSHTVFFGTTVLVGFGVGAVCLSDSSEVPVPGEHVANSSEVCQIVEEPNTHASFPLYLSPRDRLVAAGVRLMTPLKVQVYALGLYVDPCFASSTPQAVWKSCSSNELLANPKFWAELTSPVSELRRTLRIQIVREVSGKHMQHGFDRGLIPRVRHAAKNMDLPGGKDALRKFNASFKRAGMLNVGKQVLITCEGHGKLLLEIEGQPAVELDNKALVWAVLDMFLGDKPVAPNVKENFAAGFVTLFEQQKRD